MENIEIIDLAVMCLAVYRSPGDEMLAKRFVAAVERAHNWWPQMEKGRQQ